MSTPHWNDGSPQSYPAHALNSDSSGQRYCSASGWSRDGTPPHGLHPNGVEQPRSYPKSSSTSLPPLTANIDDNYIAYASPPSQPGLAILPSLRADAGVWNPPQHAQISAIGRDLIQEPHISSVGYHDGQRVNDTRPKDGKAKDYIDAGEGSLLHKDFRLAKYPQRFFTIGKVFTTLWTEPGSVSTNAQTELTDKAWTINNFGELVYSKVRRFIVVREGYRQCTAVPVTTYNNQGVAKSGVAKSEHAIVYIGKQAPLPTKQELRKAGLLRQAIRVDPDAKDIGLDEMSRIALAEPHLIQHNLKVKSIGKVNRDFITHLINQYRTVNLCDGASENMPTAPKHLEVRVPVIGPSSINGLLADAKVRHAYDSMIAIGMDAKDVERMLAEGIAKLQLKRARARKHRRDSKGDDEGDTSQKST